MKQVSRWPALAVALLLTGCGSVPTHYYTLCQGLSPEHSEQGTVSPLIQRGVVVSTVSIPDLVDRIQLVTRESSTSVHIAESRQWAQPLRDQIPDIIVRNLRLDLGSLNVVEDAHLLADVAPLKVVVKIEQFDATPGNSVTVSARWVISGGAAKAPSIGELSVTQPVSNGDFDTIVDAWSQALATISTALAKALQAAD